jgi:hypothetical protein
MWPDKAKPFKARAPFEREFAAAMAAADAPAAELLRAKIAEYIANTPTRELRWPHIWLKGKGWTCTESSPAAKEERPTSAAEATHKRKRDAKGEGTQGHAQTHG